MRISFHKRIGTSLAYYYSMGKTGLRNSIPRRKQSVEPHRPGDPYRSTTKPLGNTYCSSCGAKFLRGRWVSQKQMTTQKPARRILCPACRQLKEHYAMGVVELHGEQWKENADQVLKMIEKTEKIERSRNDQERILWSNTSQDVTKIYVTLPELARHIGHQLRKSFKGKVEYHRSTEEPYLRVVWHPRETKIS